MQRQLLKNRQMFYRWELNVEMGGMFRICLRKCTGSTFRETRNAVKMLVCIACCLDDLACRIHSAK